MMTPTLSGLSIKRLDHLGLVSGMCRGLGIIDTILPKDNDHKVSHGEVLLAMILNGLGFHRRTLHMFPDFFADKTTERSIVPGVLPKHLNDLLGCCLDALFEADVSALYQVILELICENQAGLPVYMQALSGNTNNRKAFGEVTRHHIQSIKTANRAAILLVMQHFTQLNSSQL